MPPVVPPTSTGSPLMCLPRPLLWRRSDGAAPRRTAACSAELMFSPMRAAPNRPLLPRPLRTAQAETEMDNDAAPVLPNTHMAVASQHATVFQASCGQHFLTRLTFFDESQKLEPSHQQQRQQRQQLPFQPPSPQHPQQ